MRSAFVLAALESAVAFAQYPATTGPLQPGIFSGAVPERAASAAGRHPNATSEVSFTRIVNSTAENWKWRINVTEVALPNNVYNYGKPNQDYSMGYHVVNVQWQLDWPKSHNGSQQSLQSYLAETQQSLYLTGLALRFPSSLMGNWTSPSDGACTSLFGEECIGAIQSFASSKSNYYGGATYTLPECAGTFNTGQSNPFLDAGAQAKILPTYQKFPIEADDTISFSTSNSYRSGNDTTYDWVVSVVHIMILEFPRTSDGPTGNTSPASVLCQVVDYKPPSRSKSGSQGGGSTDTSSAPTLGQSAVTIGLVVAVSMLLAIL